MTQQRCESLKNTRSVLLAIEKKISNFDAVNSSMSDTSNTGSDFINQVENIILQHIGDEQFGVSELASAMNMSRSSLLRKIKKHTRLSASRFIRQVRLKKGMELLQQTSLTVSEISYKVGFGSTSYFTKCFREYYGHPPGEVGKREFEEETGVEADKKRPLWITVGAAALLVVLAGFFFFREKPAAESTLEKSIAVLPFKNDSSDSTNIYFINGLMEATLTNLQKIEGFRVVSRTSVEKYRDSDMSAPEIAEDLNVNYLVEGSGQKSGDEVLLNIQLIEAASDRHIWAEQFSREVEDIFELQNEVARNIAGAIEVVVTPAELEQIEKKPTENLLAYDYFLQALEPYHARTKEGLEEAIPLFKKALEHDEEFALAYGNLAISYYFLDIFQRQKQYTELINNYADKALLYDSKSAVSLVAKAFYYMHTEDYNLALPHLEKALEYNPNSSFALQMLSDLYARFIPNTAKYLEYALRGLQIELGANDSISQSYLYLNLSNAFVQSGFVEESIFYVNKSLDYFPENEYAPLVKAYALYARDRDLKELRERLMQEWEKNNSRIDILQEIAKVYYFEEDYDNAYFYYKKFVNTKDSLGMDVYPHEDVKIAMVYKKKGLEEEAARFFEAYTIYCDNDQSIYKAASTAVKYAYEGEVNRAITQLELFALQDNIQYWILLFMRKDPLMKNLEDHPEFEGIMKKISDRFWDNQQKLKVSLEEKGLL